MDEAGGIGHVPDGALAIRDGRIAWVGTRAQLQALSWSAPVVTEARGLWITPGLIECHTHLVYARRPQQRVRGAPARRDLRRDRPRGRRNRVDDARDARGERRRAARAVAAARTGAGERRRDDARNQVGLRARSRERTEDAARRASASASNSGSTSSRRFSARTRCRRSSRTDRTTTCVTSATTCCPQSRGSGSPTLPMCSASASPSRGSRPSECSSARAVSAWRLRLHADQLSDGGGGELAARYGALSADHLEYASDASLRRMARSGSRRRPAARCVLFSARDPAAADRTDARARRSDGGVDRLQSGHVADRIAPAGDEHGVRAVPHDCSRGAARRDGERGTRARARRGSRNVARRHARRPCDLEATSSGAAVRRGRHAPAGRNL